MTMASIHMRLWYLASPRFLDHSPSLPVVRLTEQNRTNDNYRELATVSLCILLPASKDNHWLTTYISCVWFLVTISADTRLWLPIGILANAWLWFYLWFHDSGLVDTLSTSPVGGLADTSPRQRSGWLWLHTSSQWVGWHQLHQWLGWLLSCQRSSQRQLHHTSSMSKPVRLLVWSQWSIWHQLHQPSVRLLLLLSSRWSGSHQLRHLPRRAHVHVFS